MSVEWAPLDRVLARAQQRCPEPPRKLLRGKLRSGSPRASVGRPSSAPAQSDAALVSPLLPAHPSSQSGDVTSPQTQPDLQNLLGRHSGQLREQDENVKVGRRACDFTSVN